MKKLTDQKPKSSKKLVDSLAAAKIDALINYSNGDEYVCEIDEPIESNFSNIIRHINPERQALTVGELVQLVKADQLELSLSGSTESLSEFDLDSKVEPGEDTKNL